MIGTVLVIISSALSLLILRLNAAQQPKQVKIILFGLYFWGLIFLQLTIGALIRYGLDK